MNINRHNYEEFLLLYIDGELDAESTKQVELFIEQNPDIQQELNSLMDTKLQAEEIAFGDISVLLKQEDKAISTSNFEEYFLLYADNELSAEQRKETETFVLQHPQLQNDFTSLNKAKLPAETVECPDKEKLYKKEKTPVFYLQRIAVAAVFIGAMFFVWMITDKKIEKNTVVVSSPKPIENKTVTQPASQQPDVVNIDNAVVKQRSVIVNQANKSFNTNQAQKTVIQNAKNEIVNTVAATSENTTGNTISKSTSQQVTNQADIAAGKKPNEIVAVNTIAATNNDNKINRSNIETANAFVTNNNNNTVITQTVYKTLDDDDDETTKQPNKIGGLFKKVKQLITPKDPNSDDGKKLVSLSL